MLLSTPDFEDHTTVTEEMTLVRMADNTFGFRCDIAVKIPNCTLNEHCRLYIRIG